MFYLAIPLSTLKYFPIFLIIINNPAINDLAS